MDAPSSVHADALADVGHPRRWSILAVLCLSLVLIILGNTVLNVTIPTLVRDLHADQTQLQWIVDAYSLVFAGLLMTMGAMGDRFGRKGALQLGLLIFGLASLVSTQANDANQLIATRAVMGIGAALVMPATLSILTNIFPPHERAKAIAIWAGLSGAGAAIGPISGGFLIKHYYWGSVFYVNVVVVLIALAIGARIVPTSKDPAEAPLDPIGAGLSILGLGALLYGIIEAPNHGWGSPETLAAFGIAIAVLIAFGVWETRTPHPMLDIRFFRDRRFSASSVSIMLVFFSLFGLFFLMTQYLQLVKGYDPLQAGFRTLPQALTMMVLAPMSARVVERVGARAVVTGGLTLLTISLLLVTTLGESSSYLQFLLILVIMAAGMSAVMPPATALIMSSLPLGKAGVGSAVNDTTRELGGALGVAVLGSVLASIYHSHLHVGGLGLSTERAAAAAASLGSALQLGIPEVGAAAKAAFMDGIGAAALVGAAVTGVASLLAYRFIPAAHHLATQEDPFEVAPEDA
jgi:EmrB/QacA subfamily drug resistance transporter